MGKQRSDKCNYQSRYSPGTWITAAQYITEYLCENLAKKDHKELYPQFWKSAAWAKFFVFQCVLANRLLKKYPPEVIIRAIRLCSWAYSLNTKKLKAKIEEEAKRNIHPVHEPIELTEEAAKILDDMIMGVRPSVKENNLFDKLG
jgi:adenine-specific DNA methylase